MTEIEFHNLALLADLSGALYIADYDTLLVADLHFEKGSSLARFGLVIPPYDTRSTLDVLEDCIERLTPRRLISLGDSFHDRDAPERLSDEDRRRINRLGEQLEMIWITGNHDPDLPDDLPGMVCEEITLGRLQLRHEPSRTADGEICGHLHPAATIRQRGRRLRRRCFAANKNRLFMPAFGAFTGGLSVKSNAYQPYWGERDFIVWMIGEKSLHRFPSRVLL
jgi:DNA ligase-associated metallophosphoesterase